MKTDIAGVVHTAFGEYRKEARALQREVGMVDGSFEPALGEIEMRAADTELVLAR